MIEHTLMALKELAEDYRKASDGQNPYVPEPLKKSAAETYADLFALIEWVNLKRNQGEEQIAPRLLTVTSYFGQVVAKVSDLLFETRAAYTGLSDSEVINRLGWSIDHLNQVINAAFPDLFPPMFVPNNETKPANQMEDPNVGAEHTASADDDGQRGDDLTAD